MRAVEFTIVLLFLILALWYFSNRLIAYRKMNREPQEAYFTGGPLNGQSKHLRSYTPKYTYSYDHTKNVTDHGSFKSYDTELWLAIYNYQGDGLYVYQGSMDAQGHLVQDKDQVI